MRAESLDAICAVTLSVVILARSLKPCTSTVLVWMKDVYFASLKYSCTVGCDIGASATVMMPPVDYFGVTSLRLIQVIGVFRYQKDFILALQYVDLPLSRDYRAADLLSVGNLYFHSMLAVENLVNSILLNL